MLGKNDCDRRNCRIAKLATGEPPLRKRRPPETRGPQGHFRYVAAIVLAETTLRANVCYPNSLRLWLRQRVQTESLRAVSLPPSIPAEPVRKKALLLRPTIQCMSKSLHCLHARSRCRLTIRFTLRKFAPLVTRSSIWPLIWPYCHGRP